MERLCSNCGKDIEKFGLKFCSQKCYRNYWKRIYDKRHIRFCGECKKEFICPASFPSKKFCSRKCYKESLVKRKWSREHKNRIKKTLKDYWKNKVRQGFPQKEESKKKISQTLIKKEVNRKEKNGNWKGGISTENNLLRNSPEYDKWRKKVYKRDGYLCQVCFIKGGYLEAHHIKRWSKYPELRYHIDNGLTVHKGKCHQMKDKESKLLEKTCVERKEAFKLAGVVDPTQYD
jgi:hypothetical protein